jgi:DNA-binding ferritin-like protein
MANSVKIKNQYEDRTASDIWDNLSKTQKQHFIYDHLSEIEEYMGKELKSGETIKAFNSDYNELHKDIKNRFENHVREGQYAKGGMVVTKIADIPNFQKRLDEGKITYRGLGLGKKFDEFYDLTGTTGTRIKVDEKEYYITDEEFDTFSRGEDGKLRIRFDAPYRKGYAEGGEMSAGVDLFEDYENIPTEVNAILEKYDNFQDADYEDLNRGLEELEKIGYTFNYGLDASPYDLRKIGEKGRSEVMEENEYAKGGKVKSTFDEKVKAISKRLVGQKVPKKYKKEYGATYDKAEAKQAGRRIAGSQLVKLKEKMEKMRKAKKKS